MNPSNITSFRIIFDGEFDLTNVFKQIEDGKYLNSMSCDWMTTDFVNYLNKIYVDKDIDKIEILKLDQQILDKNEIDRIKNKLLYAVKKVISMFST